MKEFTVDTFDHRKSLALGVCGHWWQDANPTLEDILMYDCPRCGRPPSHIMVRSLNFSSEVWEIVFPADCAAPGIQTDLSDYGDVPGRSF